MEKYIDAEKLIAEIRRIVEEETPISKGSDYYHAVADTADKLLSFLDSLQEETQTTYNGMVDEDSFLQLTNGEFIDLCPGLDMTALGLKPGDKVKLIIVKEQ